MSEHVDDTTERDAPSPAESEPRPGGYYYDDSTGYEVYDPSKEEDDPQEEEEPTDARGACPSPRGQSREPLKIVSSGKP